MNDGGKGSGRRPGTGYGSGHERIFGARGSRKRQVEIAKTSIALVRLHRDEHGTIVHSEAVEPIPGNVIAKNFGGWNSLEEIVRWVEKYHGVKGNQ